MLLKSWLISFDKPFKNTYSKLLLKVILIDTKSIFLFLSKTVPFWSWQPSCIESQRAYLVWFQIHKRETLARLYIITLCINSLLSNSLSSNVISSRWLHLHEFYANAVCMSVCVCAHINNDLGRFQPGKPNSTLCRYVLQWSTGILFRPEKYFTMENKSFGGHSVPCKTKAFRVPKWLSSFLSFM